LVKRYARADSLWIVRVSWKLNMIRRWLLLVLRSWLAQALKIDVF
jgi:hypothetical protein